MSYKEPRPSHVLGWTIVVLCVIVALSATVWVIGVVLSGPKGAGEAIKQRNSAVNRVQKQEMFEDLAAEYDGAVVKIDAYGQHPTGEFQKTERQGLVQHCIDVAQQFNAESLKYSSRVWKSTHLPRSLDASGCTGREGP